jgi:hypothetical protein
MDSSSEAEMNPLILIRGVAGRVTAFAADRHFFIQAVAVLANGAAVRRSFDVAGDRALTFLIFARLRVAIHALSSLARVAERRSVERLVAGSHTLRG